jgi:NosR/NirI family nitrous oxide reductase transcriptional regulator
LLLVLAPALARAADVGGLRARLTPELIAQVFPGADEVGADAGTPPALPVRIGGAVAGYIFSTRDTVNATGYAGTPFDLVGGIAMDGRITGAAVLEEHESILNRGVSRTIMDTFVAGFAAATLRDWRAVKPDQVKGATTSARLMKSGMQAAARVVASDRLPQAPVEEPTLDRNTFALATVAELLRSGGIAHLRVPFADVQRAFVAAAGEGAAPQHRAPPDAPFLDVFLALLTPPAIGANILGLQRYNEALDRQGEGGLTLWIANVGEYPYASTVRSRLATGFFEDVVTIQQGVSTIRLLPSMLRGIRAIGGGTELDEMDAALVFLPAGSGLDPLRPWRVTIAVQGRTADGAAFVVPYAVPYTLPSMFILLPPPEPPPAWIEAWQHRRVDVALLLVLLAAVTAVFLSQDALVRHRTLYLWTRVAVLSATLVWLGWWVGGQLSVVNVLALLQAPFTDTPLAAFLLDPIVLVLSAYVAVMLLILGRGVYCGWLCPFGALQELSNKLATLLRVPQLRIPQPVHERLWSVKYLVAIAIIGLVFVAPALSHSAAEVEPFKTAISVKFAREAPYILHAAALLVIKLFVERFYCRFLCPLGASLAVMGRLRMVRWLKRRPQCGSECRICEVQCPVGAITPFGPIDMNECLQCLDCQVAYRDENVCPPLIQRSKRRFAPATLIHAQSP